MFEIIPWTYHGPKNSIQILPIVGQACVKSNLAQSISTFPFYFIEMFGIFVDRSTEQNRNSFFFILVTSSYFGFKKLKL